MNRRTFISTPLPTRWAPATPVMIGEYGYEGHRQTAFPDVPRYVVWGHRASDCDGVV